MEAAEVDEGIGAEEEVGNDGGDGVELSFKERRERGATCWAPSQKLPGTHAHRVALAQPGLMLSHLTLVIWEVSPWNREVPRGSVSESLSSRREQARSLSW